MGLLKTRVLRPLKQRLEEYSDRRRGFVFIHINKTGGSSIEKALRLSVNHHTASEKIARMGRREWDRRFSFSVVRNPWDRVVSHYHFRVQTNQTGLGDRQVSFRDWVRLAYGERNPGYFDLEKMFMPQTDWLTDGSGEIVVQHICRFENLAEDFDEICRILGRNRKLPHAKASVRGPYRDYYDDEIAAIIENAFRKDIENFGYSF